MSVTQPIRTKEDLKKLENFYPDTTPVSQRNHLLILMGLNTALRITDILNMKWNAVYDFANQRLKTHVELTEQKTGKYTRIVLNAILQDALINWMAVKQPAPGDAIFESARSKNPLDRYQAYRIIRRAASGCGLCDHIGCHSLRKTFGYHAWKQGVPPAVLMDIYNHSSYQVTTRYLCIDQDDRDNVFRQIQL